MRVKEFIELLNRFNLEAEMSTGNSWYLSKDVKKDSDRGNIYEFSIVDAKEKDLKKIKELLIWSDE